MKYPGLAFLGGFLSFSVLIHPAGHAQTPAQKAAAEIKALTGAPARIVWVQDAGNGKDVMAQGENLRLMGFDTEDGKGERAILSAASNYVKPLITPKGNRVVFTNRRKNKVYVVNWDGNGLREIADGGAVEVWMDPADGAEWVFYQERAADKSKPIRRARLDNPKVKRTVWDKTHVDAMEHGSFQLSADGKKAGGLFPWSESAVVDLADGSRKRLGGGCWTGLAPDNSYRFWVFDGPHRNVYVFDHGSDKGRKVDIHNAPGIDGHEVYHPRWSNHPRFMAMTGPYKVSGIGGGGPAVEIHMGRFDPGFTRIERWVQVSRNNKGDFFPDVWVAQKGSPAPVKVAKAEPKPAPKPAPKAAAKPTPAKPAKGNASLKAYNAWPGSHEGLVFLWENSQKTNEVKNGAGKPVRTCRVTPIRHARYGRFHDMDLEGGAFTPEGVDAALLQEAKKSHQLTLEALVTPGSLQQSGPARILTFSSNPNSRNFTLGQEGNKLVLRLRTPKTGDNGANPQVELLTLPDTKPHHVLVTYKPGRLAAYLDGKLVKQTDAVQGDFSNWAPQRLLFGDEAGGGRDWNGTLEGVAIYTRALEANEAKQHYDLYAQRLKNRKPAPQLAVKGKLLKVTPTPTLQSIAPYQRCLAVYEYAVEKVQKGSYKPKKILVAHWVILDGKPLPNPRKPGGSYDLTLEPFTDHPQLESERLVQDSDEFDLDLYYDVNS